MAVRLPEPGERVDNRFDLERVAGAGGMGTVFRARDARTGRVVALKVLHEGAAVDRARFAREARLLSGLNHHAIVGYIAHGTSLEGHLYLALEWLDGLELSTLIAQRKSLGVGASLAIAKRVTEGLRFAHAKGVVHRDLKPSNVFLRAGAPEKATLLDFGVARGTGHFTLTASGTFVGTPAYLPPEQALGGRDVGARSDLYALGAVLFECLTGAPPFDGRDLAELIGNVLREPAPRLASRLPGVSPKLDELVARLLAKSPDDRPASAAELLGELDALA